MDKTHDNKDIRPESLLILALGLLLAFAWNKIMAWVNVFYFNNLVSLWLGGILLVSILGLLFIARLEKKLPRLKMLLRVGQKDHAVFIGDTPDGFEINLPNKVRTGHVQIVGATGRGKTESVILPWLMRDLWQGHSAILIDGKDDEELKGRIEKHAKSIKRPIRLVSFNLGNPEVSATTNPLKRGTPQQITDRLFAAFEFEDPFYKSVQYDVAGSLVALMCEVFEEVTFKKLYELLTDDQSLSSAVSKSDCTNLKKKLVQYLSEPRKDRQQKMMGLISQIAPFAEGELAPLVNGKVDGRDEFSISDVMVSCRQQTGVLILLPTLLYQEIAFKLGKLFLQEIAFATAKRKSRHFLPVYLDEFSSFVYPGFSGLLNKARSSGIALHLSHQSMADLEAVSADFAKSVNTNTNVKCLLGLNDPTTADFFAKHLGTITEEKETERVQEKGFFKSRSRTGELSIREVEAYRISPNEMKHYTRGKGVIAFTMPEGVLIERVQFEAIPETKENR